jgi:hypothetical protein
MFNEVVCQKYRLQVLSQNLKQRLLKLAQDIISLGYDAKTEKSLLSLMENAYNDFKAVTAATDWEENIKKNKEKQEKLRKERQERNLKAKQAYKKTPLEQKLSQKLEDSPKEKAVKDKIANIINVDFSEKSKKSIGLQDKEKEQRIMNSLHKINQLMSELRDKAAEEARKRIKAVD